MGTVDQYRQTLSACTVMSSIAIIIKPMIINKTLLLRNVDVLPTPTAVRWEVPVSYLQRYYFSNLTSE